MTPFQQACQDIHDIKGSTRQSVQLQALQAGILFQMSATMGSIHAEIVQVRQQMAEGLAIQQELLARERVQAYLEEFIYQTQKLVAECSKAQSPLAPPTRYFLLTTVLRHIENEGIATPIIKGRDNKAAFDGMVNEARSLCFALFQDTGVKEAIEWAKQIVERRELERLEREREQKEREREEERQREREREKRNREEERERKEQAHEQAKKNRQLLWIVLPVVGGLFALILAGIAGCCILGALTGPGPNRVKPK